MLGDLIGMGWALLAGAAALAGVVLAAWANGRKSERDRREVQDARDYQRTMERISDAANRTDTDDPDALRERMRRRGEPGSRL
jgi:hypothetical protein